MTFEQFYEYVFSKKREELFVYFEKGERIAVSTDEFFRRTDLMAAYISNKLKDIAKGSWVALKCINSGNWPVIFFAALKCGFKVLLLDDNTQTQQINSFIRNSDSKYVLTDSFQPFEAEVPVLNLKNFNYNDSVETDTQKYEWADMIAYVTSGTTSEAKIYTYTADALMIEQQGLFKQIKSMDEKHNIRHEQSMLQVLPLRHIFGLVTFFCLASYGNTIVFPENIGVMELVRVIRTERPWFLPAVPAIFKGLMSIVKVKNEGRCRRADFERVFGDSIVCGVCGGAKLENSVALDVLNTDIALYIGWGMTEVGTAVLGLHTPERIEKGYTGTVLDWYQAAVFDDDGNMIQSGIGELGIKGKSLHYSMLTANGEKIRSDDYFMTGDIFEYNNGDCFFLGRKKSVIISDTGENVYPEEIEEQILDITSVFQQSCIFDYKGVPALYVTASSSGNPDKIISEIKKKNGTLPAKNKIAALFISGENVPLTSKGEISRFKILDHIKNVKAKKFIIMKGLLSDADND